MPQHLGRGKTLVSAPTTTGGTWANTANMVDGTGGVINATLATWTSTTNGGTATFIVGGFESTTPILGNETLVSLGCIVRHGFSSVARISSVTAQAMDNGVAIGSPVSFNISNAQTSDKVILPVTDVQIKSPTFQIKVVATRKTVTQSCVWSVDFVDIDIETTIPMTKTELFTDNFATLDPVKWPPAGYYGTFALGAQGIGFEERPSTYSGIVTDFYYTLNESYVFCRMTPPKPTMATSETSFNVRDAGNTNCMLTVLYGDGTNTFLLTRLRQVGFADSDANPTYDPVNHAYIRMRMAGGSAYWDGSPDGTTWTNIRTITTTLNLTDAGIDLSCGQYAAEVQKGTGWFGNINIAEAPPVRPVNLVRSGRQTVNSLTCDIDVTGARTLFICNNQTSTSFTSNNAGVTLLAYDTGGPRRNTIWNIAPGTTGVVRFTRSTNALWGYVLIDKPAQDYVAQYISNNTTADMSTATVTATAAGTAVVFWNTNSLADWGAASGYTTLEKILSQNVEPSWHLGYSDSPVSLGAYTTPTMSRGKEGTSLIEEVSASILVAAGAPTGGKPKVYVGGSWQPKPVKVYLAGSWQEKPMKRWDGSQWKPV